MTGHINTGAFFTTKHCGVTVSPNLGQQQNESGDKNRSVKNPDKHPHGVNVVHYMRSLVVTHLLKRFGEFASYFIR